MREQDVIQAPAGRYWRNYFRTSLENHLPELPKDPWNGWEREVLGPSLAQFQLGESSDGCRLLHYARQFGAETGDPFLGEAVALFIQEENRHSRWLGEFLKDNSYPLLQKHWADDIFRAVRKPLGFGLMSAVLTCAEVAAVPYYTAVRRMTGSARLRAICDRILADETEHLRFQTENQGASWGRRRMGGLFRILHRALMAVTCLVVWKEHGQVLRHGGYTAATFLAQCQDLLAGIHASAISEAKGSQSFEGGAHGLGQQKGVGRVVNRIGAQG